MAGTIEVASVVVPIVVAIIGLLVQLALQGPKAAREWLTFLKELQDFRQSDRPPDPPSLPAEHDDPLDH